MFIRFHKTVRPTLPGFSVAPTTATDFGAKIASSGCRTNSRVKELKGTDLVGIKKKDVMAREAAKSVVRVRVKIWDIRPTKDGIAIDVVDVIPKKPEERLSRDPIVLYAEDRDVVKDWKRWDRLAFKVEPTKLVLRVGRTASVRVTARATAAGNDRVSTGVLRVAPDGGQALRVPWAIGAGYTVVLKPSEFTSGTSVRMAELAREAGIPDGVFNVVTGYGDPAGQVLAERSCTITSAGLAEKAEVLSGSYAGSTTKIGFQ